MHMVDIHCHLLPGVDDGASDLNVAIEMAQIAVQDGIGTIIATPHQLGANSQNQGPGIREAVARLQFELHQRQIPLQVLPGGDVRIESNLLAALRSGEVMTLADRGRHLLLELPHELYFPINDLLRALSDCGIQGILSHPERNQGLLANQQIVAQLVDAGCLMQVTAASVTGVFGKHCKDFAEWMLRGGLVHFLATDAHGTKTRRPLLRRAYEHAAALVGPELALELCVTNPAAVALGRTVSPGRQSVNRKMPTAEKRAGRKWLTLRRAG